MILWHRCFLLTVIVAVNADTVKKQSQPGILQTVFDYVKPYVFDDSVVVIANNSLGNVAGNVKNNSLVRKYDLTEEYEEDKDDDRTLFSFINKIKRKKKKKKKPSKGKPERPVKPDHPFEVPFKPDGEPSKPHFKPVEQPQYKPSEHEIKPVYENEPFPQVHVTTSSIDVQHKTHPQIHTSGINNETEEVAPYQYFKLPSFVPKRKIIQLTSTVVVYETVARTIYPTCLRMHNVHSICEGKLITILPTHTLPSGNIGKSESPNSKGPIQEDQIQEERKLILMDDTPLEIKPTTTTPLQMTKVATLNGTESKTFDAVRGVIEQTESIPEPPNNASTATPDLISSYKQENSTDTRMLHYFLNPKVEYSTKFHYATKTKDFYDFSHTATVIAVNCLPEEAKTLPLCPLETPAPVQNPAETYHSKFIQMIKAQNELKAFNLSEAELHYLSSKVLPAYYQVTEHDKDVAVNGPHYEVAPSKEDVTVLHSVPAHKDVATNEQLLSDALQSIQQMIFQNVMEEHQDRS